MPVMRNISRVLFPNLPFLASQFRFHSKKRKDCFSIKMLSMKDVAPLGLLGKGKEKEKGGRSKMSLLRSLEEDFVSEDYFVVGFRPDGAVEREIFPLRLQSSFFIPFIRSICCRPIRPGFI